MQPKGAVSVVGRDQMEEVELEEAAEEVAMVEPAAADCRSWQWSLHIQLPSRCVPAGGGGVAAAAGLG